MESLGCYVHIPFCIQRCRYCDFATYSLDQIKPNDEYVDLLIREISLRKDIFPQKTLSTIYFGGGTPSLLDASQIDRIIEGYIQNGFGFADNIEITIGVNPATLTNQKIKQYKKSGVNRISIGCQTFNDSYLKNCNREHTASDTLATIELVKANFNNYSLDLLFSLPEQDIVELQKDLNTMVSIDPPHISGYCLTLPDHHPMNSNRCSDSEQLEMFDLIKTTFKNSGLERYEISNFAKPGYQSIHNNIYWKDLDYWGVGLSAHSYLGSSQWGQRFWNPKSYKAYVDQVSSLKKSNRVEASFLGGHRETLAKHESLTDYCHTHLRLRDGIDENSLRQKFGTPTLLKVRSRMEKLISNRLVDPTEQGWTLSESGVFVSNQVFAELLFSSSDIDNF